VPAVNEPGGTSGAASGPYSALRSMSGRKYISATLPHCVSSIATPMYQLRQSHSAPATRAARAVGRIAD